MKMSQRLVERLRAEGHPVPEGEMPYRVYAGRHQRSAGAWSWCIEMGHYVLGSQWSMREIVEAPGIESAKLPWGGQTEIYPAQRPQK